MCINQLLIGFVHLHDDVILLLPLLLLLRPLVLVLVLLLLFCYCYCYYYYYLVLKRNGKVASQLFHEVKGCTLTKVV